MKRLYNSNKKIFFGVLTGILLVILYVAGLIAQVSSGGKSDIWGYSKGIDFNPITVFVESTFTSTGLVIAGFIIIAIGILFMVIKLKPETDDIMDERGFEILKKGTYGTSGWMTDDEFKTVLKASSISTTDDTILGIIKGKLIVLPNETRFNKHIAIFGASGTGKSRCFVRPQIIQCVKRGESIIQTDPKGEIYRDTAQYLKDHGYEVKIFNLVEPQYSDSWNCLLEITSDPTQIEIMAQTFVEVVIKNTSGPKADHFFDSAEGNLLKALILYVIVNEHYSEENKNIGAVYELLTSTPERKLQQMFDMLPMSHPAKQPWGIFQQSSDNLRGNIITGLGSRLQVFQSDLIRKITTYQEIDLELPARKKCAYFVIMSDTVSTFDFLSSLFFSFLFMRLVKYADVHGKNGKTDVPVNFILDEFPNIGLIPDFTKKLATIRSRDLRVAVIFQNISQLEKIYQKEWTTILGNCDTQLFLGTTELDTAKYISERSGEMTIKVGSTGVTRQTMTIAQTVPQYKETESSGKRYLLNKDEVLRLDNADALIILRSQKLLKAQKFDISKHPESKNFVISEVRDHVPTWKKAQSTKLIVDDTPIKPIREDMTRKETKKEEKKPEPLITRPTDKPIMGLDGKKSKRTNFSSASSLPDDF